MRQGVAGDGHSARLKIRLKVFGYMIGRNHSPYASVCFFPRQAGWPDKGNCLEGRDVISDKEQKTLALPVIDITVYGISKKH